MNSLFGLKIVENNLLTKGISNEPNKRNKNKRIQKKWIKKYGYKIIPDPKIYYFEDKIIGHPLIIRKLLKKLK
jgi:hypothetical protein